MKLTKISVDVDKVADILNNNGATFETPISLEKLAIEIYSSCTAVEVTDNSEYIKNASFEVSYSNGN